MLARLRLKGCPNASRVKPREASGGGVTLRLNSPVTVAEDWAWLSATLLAGASARLKVNSPAGWALPASHVSWGLAPGGSTAPVAVPQQSVQQDHRLELSVEREGTTTKLALEATVVRWVP